MRTRILLAFAAVLLATPVLAQAHQEDSVAEAARKAREKRKSTAQAKKSFTNDDIQVGNSTKAAQTATGASTSSGGGEAAPAEGKVAGEKEWRQRFADARNRLAETEKELAILQRELSQNQVQYYPDPQKTLEQETLRADINAKRKKIEEKQKEVATQKQAIEDMERELRAAGGPPGWARQ
ncbi:MAG: hypothetical protein HY046_07435 [Acidobacteria bacterium]|nr:hypothetical protein [Acidobacteriota bacterium]